MAVNATLRISDPGELPRAAAALGRCAQGIDGVGREVDAACRRIEARVAQDVTALRDRLRRAEHRRAAVDPEDQAVVQRAEVECERARRALAHALPAQRQVIETLIDLRRTTQRRVSAARERSEAGGRGLRTFWERLDRSRSAFASAMAAHQGPGAVAGPSLGRAGLDGPGEGAGSAEGSGGGAPAASAPDLPVVADGRRVLVPLDRLVDLDPISGPEAFEKVSLQEIYRGLRLLEDHVLPGVRRGLRREDFRALDEQSGTSGQPEGLLFVYDVFFGGDDHAVVAARLPHGRYSIEAGRHRFWAACRMLMCELPVRLR